MNSEIEQLREQLYNLIDEGLILCSDRVVKVSQQLDEMLNEFNRKQNILHLQLDNPRTTQKYRV